MENEKLVQGWKSPIDVTYEDAIEYLEDSVLCKVNAVVNVDKDELFRALKYDRGQFEMGCAHGYAMGKIDGYNEAMEKIRGALFPEKDDDNNG